MKFFRYCPELIGVAGVILPGAILFLEELATYHFEMANPGRGICGMPAFSAVLLGTLLAILLGIIGSLWAYFAHRHDTAGFWKWRTAAIALTPIWFLLFAWGIFSGFAILPRR